VPAGDITECRYIHYRDQQRYLDDGWTLIPQSGPHAAGRIPNEAALRKQLNAIKDEQFPWMGDVTKNAPQQAIKNLGTAFKNFFEGRAKFPTYAGAGETVLYMIKYIIIYRLPTRRALIRKPTGSMTLPRPTTLAFGS
jgi:transposase